MHFICAAGYRCFHIPDLITQGIRRGAQLHRFPTAVFGEGDHGSVGAGIFLNFEEALLKCRHAAFRLFGMKGQRGCGHFVRHVHQKDSHLLIHAAWRVFYL